MRLMLGSLLALALAFPAAAMPLHEFSDVALSPDGKRVAAVESDSEPNSSELPAERVVIRDARNASVISTLPVCAGCRYPDLTFTQDGRLFVVVKDKANTRLLLEGNDQTSTLTSFAGIAQKPRISPD